jgi:hypothetical protein
MANELATSPQQAGAAGIDDGPLLLVRIAALRRADALVLGSALALYDHISASLRELLDLFVREHELPEVEGNLLFWGIHIIAGARDESAFPAIMRLFSLPESTLASLLGDADTVTASKIIAGTFNGDHEALMALIAQPDADPYLRWAALTALAFLTFDGRIDLATTEHHLRNVYERRLFDEDGLVGYAWSLACALLGLDHFAPLVRAAFDEQLIDDTIYRYEDWDRLLAEAHERPTDVARFHDESAGYFEDLFVDMEWVHDPGADDALDEDPTWLPPPEPLRSVGRNDPCPCGSGKKYKKCCMQ